MKTSKILKTVVAIAAVAASGFASAAGVFTVNPTAADPTYVNLLGSFQSDYIAGNYQEVVTLTPATPLGGTFAYSIFWRGTEFDLGGVAVDTGLGDSSPVSTGLGVSYTLFATLYGSGTYTLSNAGPTPDVAFSPALGGTLNLFADFSVLVWSRFERRASDLWSFALSREGPPCIRASSCFRSSWRICL